MDNTKLTRYLGLLILGCSAEHTIADEADSEQQMAIISRPVCVEMCEYSLACGSIAASDLDPCSSQCEADCTRLEALIPARTYNADGTVYTRSAADYIEEVHACHLASECAVYKQPMCDPRDLTSYADALEGKTAPPLNGTLGMTSCSMREEALTCESSITQNRDNRESWSLSCERTDVNTTQWSCSCKEYGAVVATVTGTPAADDPAFLDLCWSQTQLACFYAGQPNCGRTTAGMN